MKIVKYFLFFLMIMLFWGCGKKNVMPDYISVVDGYFKSYVRTVLSGKFKLADSFFKKAEKSLILADDNCNLARLYIKRYFIEEEFNSQADSFLLKAKRFAKLSGSCKEEKKIVNGLLGDFKVNVDDKFYKCYFSYLQGDLKGDLLACLKDVKMHNYTKSKIYRMLAADSYQNSKDKANDYLVMAYQIDRLNSYTMYLIEDLSLFIQICEDVKTDCYNLYERRSHLIEMIKN